jgi:hypothetical protein
VRNHDERNQHSNEEEPTRHAEQRPASRGIASSPTKPGAYRRRRGRLDEQNPEWIGNVGAQRLAVCTLGCVVLG